MWPTAAPEGCPCCIFWDSIEVAQHTQWRITTTTTLTLHLCLPLRFVLQQPLLLPHTLLQLLLALYYPPLLHLTLAHTSSPFQHQPCWPWFCLPLTLQTFPFPQLPNPTNMTIPLSTTPLTVMRQDNPLLLYTLTVSRRLLFPGHNPNVTLAPSCLTPQTILTLQLTFTLTAPLPPCLTPITCSMYQRVVTQHQSFPLPQ